MWIQEVIVSLPENAWQKVPQWLHDELSDAFSAFGTKDAEDRFNCTRRHVRLDLSSTMQPLVQWHNLAHSNLAHEAGGKPVPVDSKDRHVHSGHFHKSSFQNAEENSFSLGRECVRKWMAQKDCHTPSASNFCQNVYRTSALLESESDLTMLQELWRSELLQVGTVCVHRNDLLESTAC